MIYLFLSRIGIITTFLSLFPFGSLLSVEEPVVHALLFFSPTCPHCHKVITEDLPPLLEEFGDQIVILGINTYTEVGNELFLAALEQFNIPQENAGVPMLITGETVLIGSIEIPQQFPELISRGLELGGVDWPDIPGLAQLLIEESLTGKDEDPSTEDQVGENAGADNQEDISNVAVNQGQLEEEEIQTEESSTVTGGIEDSFVAAENLTMIDRFSQDRAGNSISTVILIGMIFSVIFAGGIVTLSNHVPYQWPNWIVSILLVIGLTVSIYMAFVEITQSEAVCGPIGDCNTVQQSPYALLFGLIPIGLLGVLGYLVIGLVWLVALFSKKKWQNITLKILWGLLLFGTLFSIYLTFLEPFVIGATCVWCLTSAVTITLLFWIFTANIQQSGGLNNFKFTRQGLN
jgi:uncharacterized membrane protein/thiol-disulfide isomerase/thioredoxin